MKEASPTGKRWGRPHRVVQRGICCDGTYERSRGVDTAVRVVMVVVVQAVVDGGVWCLWGVVVVLACGGCGV